MVLRSIMPLLVLACLLGPSSYQGAVITNYPIADTTLSETFPTNNFGGMTFANSGTTQNFTKNRALYKFDIAGSLPAGVRILSSFLVIEVLKGPSDGYNFSDFGLYRARRSWGEGNKVTPITSQNAGTGAPAGTNEATWFTRFAFTTNTWASPGGAPIVDYSATPSAIQTIYGTGNSPYKFGPASPMTADVQTWADTPQLNFGWFLIGSSEGVDFTARRFGTHENPDYAPYLVINYVITPRITKIQRSGTSYDIFFTASAGQSYVVEFRNSLSNGSWQTFVTLDPQPTDSQVIVIDTEQTPTRFYRIKTF